jgi:hypothetical protein
MPRAMLGRTRICCRQPKPENSAASALARALGGGVIRITTGSSWPPQKAALCSSNIR